MRSLRLLPLTMLVAFLLLGIKVGEVMRDSKTLVLSFTSEARAQQPAPTAENKDAKPADAAATDTAGTKPATPATSDAKTTDAEKPKDGDKKDDTKTELKPIAPSSGNNDDDSDENEPTTKREFSQVEVDLLQSLAKRRQDLDDWAKQIQLKQNMLIATEQRINDKIDNLQKMRKEIEALLAQYNEQEDIKIRSLVKIYENMKPKDAARIFEELDMPVLLTVVDKMSERKVAPILAGMSPTKAKDLTIQLAEQRKLQKARVPGSASDNSTPAPASSTPATTPAGR